MGIRNWSSHELTELGQIWSFDFTTLDLPERPPNLVHGETADTLYVCAQT